MIKLDQLKVYRKALVLCASAETLCASWGKRHAIHDHFRRASESIVLNVAQGARLRGGPDKIRMVDYAVGSSLECAACLDIACVKGCMSQAGSTVEKRHYLEVTRMLIGLRRGWLPDSMHEDPSPYETQSNPEAEVLFHHESLDVYQVGLEFMRWFVGLPGGSELTDRWCREVDKAATSVVLNVAEGNGRYSELDHGRFLEIAAGSAAKAIAYLDLYQQRTAQPQMETNQGRELLFRVLAMLSGF